MRVRTSVGLCCLCALSGCKSWSWSPSEWFASSTAPAAGSTATGSVVAVPPPPTTEAGGLAGSGPGQTLPQTPPLGRPISTGQAKVPSPGRPAVQEPRYLPHSPPGHSPPAPATTPSAPSRDNVTWDVPPTERTAAVSSAAVAPRVGMETAETASAEPHVAENPAAETTQIAAKGQDASDSGSGRWQSAWQGWQTSQPAEPPATSEEPSQPRELGTENAATTQAAAAAPRTGSQVREHAGKPATSTGGNRSSSAPGRLPQQPIAIPQRPL